MHYSSLAKLFITNESFIFSSQNCSFWLPVTPVSEESCLKYIGGSHRWGKWFVPTKFATLTNYNYRDLHMDTDKIFEDPLDIDAEPEKYKLFSWNMEVGTVEFQK